jgi:hypothetical protein
MLTLLLLLDLSPSVWAAVTPSATDSVDDHWAFRPIIRQAFPPSGTAEPHNPIDAFVIAKLKEKGLSPSPEADRRTLIRRLFYDLTGLPPTPEETDAFAVDERPGAYERLVDRLLASPRYGERWAQHWIDIVHYGDTHGYDKDKLRPNAWPYRDYVIRSFNEDKNYDRFVKEQLAGDYFYKGSPDGIAALGFIAAGPWDLVGHSELREGTIDKLMTRNLDRDDMVAATMNTFVSATAQCARCHDHKFDPISKEDYYSLQAVFAAVDRADRSYDLDPAIAATRMKLQTRRDDFLTIKTRVESIAAERAGVELVVLDQQIAAATAAVARESPRAAFGYHSKIEQKPDEKKWVQIDLGKSLPIDRIVYVGAHDTYGGIGAGFGFPRRYRVEISDDPTFAAGVGVIEDCTAADVANPGTRPQTAPAGGKAARYVRFTATLLAERTRDYIFALGEMQVLAPDGSNLAKGATVTAMDSIEAPPRWQSANLIDGYYYGLDKTVQGAASAETAMAALANQRRALLERAAGEGLRKDLADAEAGIAAVNAEIQSLPSPTGVVFAAATSFNPIGGFVPTNGKPRSIHILKRGSEKSPGAEALPGTIHAIANLPSRFDLPPGHDEALRRAALAEWIVDRRNSLTWRSIVNRVWHYHFGRGIVETPNDFGRMGATPTHPELLDWLALEFRDGGSYIVTPRSLKGLHRLIVTSATYRQSSADNATGAKIDTGNRYLWRMNRARLDAELLRDSMLLAAEKLDLKMGGPGFRAFGLKDDHSPHYKYEEFDPDDPATHRRSIYRFIVRSVPDPFMETFDCADPSQLVAKRNETLTALQALALLNNKFTLCMSEHLAARARGAGRTDQERAAAAFRFALGRWPDDEERKVLGKVAQSQGLASACRVIFNLNEFTFVD